MRQNYFRNGADPNGTWTDGDTDFTPLMVACLFGLPADDDNIVQILLDGGADPNIACIDDGDFISPLTACVRMLKFKFVETLIRGGCDVTREIYGQSLLLMQCFIGGEIRNKLLENKGNIRVICRVRPILDVERRQADGQDVDITEMSGENGIIITRGDGLFSLEQRTKFAYGQTGSGKTFTTGGSLEGPGISPRAIRSLFEEATKAVTDGDDNDESTLNAWTYKFKFSVLEIYSEAILDLLPSFYIYICN